MQLAYTAKYFPFPLPRKIFDPHLGEKKENQQRACVPNSEAKYRHFVGTT